MASIDSPIDGLAAEFDLPDSLLEAARAIRKHGYSRFEAYSPYPIKELDEVVPGSDRVPLLVLLGGITGLLFAWALQYYSAVLSYPLNIGGRPLNSWPAFVPIMFELTVLFAAFGAFFGTLWLCGLPRLNFPDVLAPRVCRSVAQPFHPNVSKPRTPGSFWNTPAATCNGSTRCTCGKWKRSKGNANQDALPSKHRRDCVCLPRNSAADCLPS